MTYQQIKAVLLTLWIIALSGCEMGTEQGVIYAERKDDGWNTCDGGDCRYSFFGIKAVWWLKKDANKQDEL